MSISAQHKGTTSLMPTSLNKHVKVVTLSSPGLLLKRAVCHLHTDTWTHQHAQLVEPISFLWLFGVFFFPPVFNYLPSHLGHLVSNLLLHLPIPLSCSATLTIQHQANRIKIGCTNCGSHTGLWTPGMNTLFSHFCRHQLRKCPFVTTRVAPWWPLKRKQL